jgi:hypothetical protein
MVAGNIKGRNLFSLKTQKRRNNVTRHIPLSLNNLSFNKRKGSARLGGGGGGGTTVVY